MIICHHLFSAFLAELMVAVTFKYVMHSFDYNFYLMC